MMKKKRCRQAVLLLASVFMCILYGNTAIAAGNTNNEKYYEIQNLTLKYDSTTGQVKASWKETEKSTDKVVLIYLDDVFIATETVSGMYCDLSNYVEIGGAGSYSVSVYPVKLGEGDTKDSNAITITEKNLEKVRAFRSEDYAFDTAQLVYDAVNGTIKGTWHQSEYKSAGRVLLYKGTTVIDTWKSAGYNSYDFTSMIAKKGTGTYTFKVYPARIGDQYTIVSEEFDVTSDMIKKLKNTVSSVQKNEEANRIGWFHNGPTNIWYYYKTKGVKAAKEWLTIDGKRYHFSSGGIMQIGWAVIDGYFYYFDENGVLAVSKSVDGYRLNEAGQRTDEAGNLISAKGEREAPAVPTSLKTCTISVTESSKEGPGYIKEATFKEGTGFKIESISCSAEYKDWKVGIPVSVRIVVVPSTNYYFDSNVKFSARNCKSIKSTGGTMRRTVTFNYYPKKQLIAPTVIYLNGTETICWKKAESASRYKVVITQDGTQKLNTVVNTNKCSITNYVDLSNEDSVYTVKIYSMGAESTSSYLLTSSAATIDNLRTYSQNNTIDGELTWNSTGLKLVDGTGENANGWKKLFGNWYYFKNNGYAAGPGWFKDPSNLWYYFDNEYRMCTGTITDGNKTYFLNDGSVKNLPLGAWVNG